MSTTTLDRPVDLMPVAPSSGDVSRDRFGDALLVVMAISVILAVYGAAIASTLVLLTAGSVAAVVGLAFALVAPVIPSGR